MPVPNGRERRRGRDGHIGESVSRGNRSTDTGAGRSRVYVRRLLLRGEELSEPFPIGAGTVGPDGARHRPRIPAPGACRGLAGPCRGSESRAGPHLPTLGKPRSRDRRGSAGALQPAQSRGGDVVRRRLLHLVERLQTKTPHRRRIQDVWPAVQREGRSRGRRLRVSQSPAYPTVCGTPSGGFVATWTITFEGGYLGAVRRSDAEGRPVGDELILPGARFLRPMCRFEEDSFVLGWTAPRTGLRSRTCRSRRRRGPPRGSPAARGGTVHPNFEWAAPLAGGGFLATWFAVRSGGGGAGEVFGRWMTATGETASDPFQINVTAEQQASGGSVSRRRLVR